jgi:sugar (pentulose or hexulose) kinase
VLRWYRDVLGSHEASLASDTGADVFDVITSIARDYQTDLVFHPHLGGSRFAFADPRARGDLQGITFATSRRDIVRALLEGVAYELAVMSARLERHDIHTVELIAAGGGSLSSVWLQIIADTLSLPIESTVSRDAAAHGAALVAAAGTGQIRSIDLGGTNWRLPVRQSFQPRPEWTEYHKRGLRRYVEDFHGSGTGP